MIFAAVFLGENILVLFADCIVSLLVNTCPFPIYESGATKILELVFQVQDHLFKMNDF